MASIRNLILRSKAIGGNKKDVLMIEAMDATRLSLCLIPDMSSYDFGSMNEVSNSRVVVQR